jgi:hypothetical protein
MSSAKNEEPPAPQPRGCLPRLTVWLLLLAAIGLGFSIFYMAQPQDLKDIQGYLPESRALLRRDLQKMLQTSHDRSYPVTITEGEINDWLRGVVKASQGGLLAGEVSLDGVWVRLEEGRAEIVLERKVKGKPFTVSMYLQVAQSESEEGTKTEVKRHGGGYHEYLPFPTVGGRFGKLPVPQGFLLLVLPSFEKLATLFPDEIRLGFEDMTRIKIEKNRLTLDPRVPTRTVTNPP